MKCHLENPSIPTCWHREAPTSCLRIEIPDGTVRLFPYGNLITAVLLVGTERESIQIHFANHQIELVGRNLRDLLFALQDFAVMWIRITPERRYQRFADYEAALISIITNREIE